jgi:AcrR family transcriptional regulator
LAVTPTDPSQHLRRVPQQARSRERIESVLEAADRLLATEGVEALTTTRVAAAAGISVGSLYQWFPDREAIAAALALRYAAGFRRVMDELETRGDPAGAALEAFANAFRAEPGFRAMWFGGLRTQALRDLTRPGLREIAAAFAKALAREAPGAPPLDVVKAAETTVITADALLRHAFRLHPDGDPVTLEEAKRLLRGYLAQRLDIPDPTAK